VPAVLFICSANQCRSPMAEALFRDIAADLDPETLWRVASAGTWAVPGLPATASSRQAMLARGLDLSRHASQSASCDLLATFDLVLTMEHDHLLELQAACPRQAPKVRRLSEMVGGEFDIGDPIGGPPQGYESLAQALEELLRLGYPEILRSAEAHGRS
jgi:protein-tyrosine-phosphatase